MRTDLPIHTILPALQETLAQHNRLVLEAPPGAGKTTQVPLALLHAPWRRNKIIMLEPRRLAARAAAEFMAKQLNETVGQTVGYRIRHDVRVSETTQIEVVTEAILTRLLQDDPTLANVDVILFDEFHERHLHADLSLALALNVQDELRDDLRIVVMSATLDGERLAGFLEAPRLRCEGRQFPVVTSYFPAKLQEQSHFHCKRAILHVVQKTQGDILVFLPGKKEIGQLQKILNNHIDYGGDVKIVVLHGELDIQQQAVLLQNHGQQRHIILATNVAESSVTLPNVTAVVDSGLAREPRFDPSTGFTRLDTVMISLSSANQRAGRAGRTQAGICVRLWPESQRLEQNIRPELTQSELTPLALEIACWGSAQLKWLDEPPSSALSEARSRLLALHAINPEGRITAHGKAQLQLGLHPRLAHMILKAPEQWRAVACDCAVVLEARSPFHSSADQQDDLRTRLAALWAFQDNQLVENTRQHVLYTLKQNSQALKKRVGVSLRTPRITDDYLLGGLVALAFPERIAKKEETQTRRYQLASGRGARLHEHSLLVGASWLVITELKPDVRDALIQCATPADEEHIRSVMPERFVIQDRVTWNKNNLSVEAVRVFSFDRIILRTQSLPVPRDAKSSALILQHIRHAGLSCLPWSAELNNLYARLHNIKVWCPTLLWPTYSEAVLIENLEDWLLPFMIGITRLSELNSQHLQQALLSILSYEQQQQLEALAPAAIAVPSGRHLPVIYTLNEVPVLAVKLQEMFGLADTPRIAHGGVPITLHLLSPAKRPIQVTQDLKSFWHNTYPEVRKELKGRYPKHPWPDDPWTAVATQFTKRKIK